MRLAAQPVGRRPVRQAPARVCPWPQSNRPAVAKLPQLGPGGPGTSAPWLRPDRGSTLAAASAGTNERKLAAR